MDISLIICLAALLAASFTDIKKREIPDWISYSFIALALAAAAAESVVYSKPYFILNSAAGLALFFILANIFYYAKVFAGGDAKLMMGLGAALGIDFNFLANILVVGGVYGIVYSAALAFSNFKNFRKEAKKVNLPLFYFILASALIFASALILNYSFLYMFAALVLFLPLLYLFSFSVEKSSLIKSVPPEKLTEGDWLAADVTIKGKTIKASFEGLSKSDIALIKKSKKNVLIKYGLPFVPVFLLAFLAELIAGNLLFVIIGI